MKKSIFHFKSSELGFGSKNFEGQSRFLNKDGTINIKRKGKNILENFDIFHFMINVKWKYFFLLVLISYLIINCIFASIYYYLGSENFGNLTASNSLEKFEELFFFSAQTLTTVGYGYVYPHSASVSTVAAIESMLGLLGFALATGILYGRFSKPKASVLYSENMILAPYKDQTALMFRIVNPKQNELVEIEAQLIVSMLNLETNSRVFLTLNLERTKISFLSLNWTIVHPIDDSSPFFEMSKEDIIKSNPEFLVMIKAMNDTYSQVVYSRSSYKAEEMVFGAKFKPMLPVPDKKGMPVLDITSINDFDLVEIPAFKQKAVISEN